METPKFIKWLRSEKCEKLRHRIEETMEAYFRVEVEGLENIPKKGPVIILPNHSGFAGADAVVLAHVIRSQIRRDVRILAHRAYFQWSRLIRLASRRFGLCEASLRAGSKPLKTGKALVLFPEGERGNFKPSYLRYRLQKFHSGFLHLALSTQATIVPCVVIGAEESHWNLATIDLSRWVDGLVLPVPMNVFPFPAKWKIRFLEPIQITNADAGGRIEEIRQNMQMILSSEARQRNFIYFPSLL